MTKHGQPQEGKDCDYYNVHFFPKKFKHRQSLT